MKASRAFDILNQIIDKMSREPNAVEVVPFLVKLKSAVAECDICRGRGYIVRRQQTGGGFTVIKLVNGRQFYKYPCISCGGRGQHISKIRCASCGRMFDPLAFKMMDLFGDYQRWCDTCWNHHNMVHAVISPAVTSKAAESISKITMSPPAVIDNKKKGKKNV